MILNEFIEFQKHCLVCDAENQIKLQGSIYEKLDDDDITTIYRFSDCVNRKKFITFTTQRYATFASSHDIDKDTFNTHKYSSFLISKELSDKPALIEFDKEFNFRMQMMISVNCPNQHYSYSSRKITVKDDSMDISRGFPIIQEELAFGHYRVISNLKKTKTFIYGSKMSQPIKISYREVREFPLDDADKFDKKIQNIILLA